MRNSGWWLVAVGLLLLALSQPAFLMLAWYFKIGAREITVANDLAAIMGAVFTAGGLIVALISLYTMANIEAVARRAVEPILEDIPKQIETRIRRYVEANGFFLEAKRIEALGLGYGVETLDAIITFIQKALTLETTINGLYAWTGRLYYYAAGLSFLKKVASDHWSGGPSRVPTRNEFPAVTSNAVQWLEKAALRQDGNATEIAAELAELSGMMGASVDRVVSLIASANQGDAHPLPSGPSSLAFLFASCHDEIDIKRVASALGIDAPLAEERIRELIAARIALPAGHNALLLLAIPKAPFGVERPDRPTRVTVLHQQSGSYGRVSWLPIVQTDMVVRLAGLPREELDEQGSPKPQQPAPMGDLLKQLLELFFVIAEWDARFPERPPP